MKFTLTENYVNNFYNTLAHVEKAINYNGGYYKRETLPVYKRVFIKVTKMYSLIIIFIVIVMFYYIYIYMNIFVLIEKNIRTVLIIFHLLFIMFLICLIRTLFTNAGEIKEEYIEMYSVISFIKLLFEYLLNINNNNNHNSIQSDCCIHRHIQWLNDNKQNILNLIINCDAQYIKEQLLLFEEYFLSHYHNNAYCDINFFELNYDNNRFCGFCLFKKPDRTHHCRYCHCCTQKLDHHCLLLATCIGENNYKFFFQTLFYLSTLLIYMLYTSIHSVYFYIKEHQYELVFFIYICYFILLCIATLIECWFFLMHVRFIINNVTTIEYKEKIHQQQINLYDNGVINNFCDVMGRNIIEWFIPLRFGKRCVKGYQYKINKDNYERYVRYKHTEMKQRKCNNNNIKDNNIIVNVHSDL